MERANQSFINQIKMSTCLFLLSFMQQSFTVIKEKKINKQQNQTKQI